MDLRSQKASAENPLSKLDPLYIIGGTCMHYEIHTI